MARQSDDLYYSAEHVWVMLEDDIATVGLTDHGQARLGDVTEVSLPADDSDIAAGDEAVNIESARSSMSLTAPLSGRILELNVDLEESPEIINEDPLGQGWLFKMQIADEQELEDLLSEEDYEEFLENED